MSELALQKVLHFTDYDLSVNQSGEISQSQQRWMLRGVYNSIALSFGVLLVLIILFHLFGRYNPLLLTVGGGVICWVIITLFGTLHYYTKIHADIHLNAIEQVTGETSLNQVIRGRKLTRSYKLDIDNKQFIINKRTLNALNEGKLYTVYFTSKSNLILSIETSKAKRKRH